jgi:hypothetical protein
MQRPGSSAAKQRNPWPALAQGRAADELVATEAQKWPNRATTLGGPQEMSAQTHGRSRVRAGRVEFWEPCWAAGGIAVIIDVCRELYRNV